MVRDDLNRTSQRGVVTRNGGRFERAATKATEGRTIYNLVPKDQALVVDSAMTVQDILPWERATSMVVTDAAWTLLARPEMFIHSPSETIPWPLVVCLYRAVPGNGGGPRAYGMNERVSKHTILERDGWLCQYCGRFGDTVDHVMPKSRGGLSTWGNLVCACKECNNRKDDNTPDEAGMPWPSVPKIGSDWKKARLQAALFTELTKMTMV